MAFKASYPYVPSIKRSIDPRGQQYICKREKEREREILRERYGEREIWRKREKEREGEMERDR